jgi:hypothetical protein
MIRLDNIEKVYRTDRIETVALWNVNLTVAEGAARSRTDGTGAAERPGQCG